jgi:hypothetical protein
LTVYHGWEEAQRQGHNWWLLAQTGETGVLGDKAGEVAVCGEIFGGPNLISEDV